MKPYYPLLLVVSGVLFGSVCRYSAFDPVIVFSVLVYGILAFISGCMAAEDS